MWQTVSNSTSDIFFANAEFSFFSVTVVFYEVQSAVIELPLYTSHMVVLFFSVNLHWWKLYIWNQT